MRCAGGAILETSSATPVDLHLAPHQLPGSTVSLRIMYSRDVAPSSEPVSVPADHEDPNYPHFPGDLEHQCGGPRSITTYTVSVNATTTVFPMTRAPLLVAPSLAISAIILATPPASDAPLSPVAAGIVIATSTPSTPAPPDTPVGDISIIGCFFNGVWVLKAQCEKLCPTWGGHKTRCNVSKRSQLFCVHCPSNS